MRTVNEEWSRSTDGDTLTHAFRIRRDDVGVNTITRAFLKQKIHEFVSPSEEVQHAIEDGQPAVLIDVSNVITRVPLDRAIEALERAAGKVRVNGATPVFSAIQRGRIRVGLSVEDVGAIAGSDTLTVASRHQLPGLITSRGDAIADVSLGMVIAELAGMRVLATTTVNGSARYPTNRRSAGYDRSASSIAYELSRNTVAVICSGPSAVDDLRESLNGFLSYGVPVIGYCSSVLPHHFVRETGIKLDQELGSAKECADAMHYLWRLGLSGGMLIVSRVSTEFSIQNEDLYAWLTSAARSFGEQDHPLRDDLTRHVASQWSDLIIKSDGRTVDAECELIRENAGIAAETAAAFAV